MRNYNYQNKWQKLLTPEIVSLLTQIHEYKGEQTLFIEAKADTLTSEEIRTITSKKDISFFMSVSPLQRRYCVTLYCGLDELILLLVLLYRQG